MHLAHLVASCTEILSRAEPVTCCREPAAFLLFTLGIWSALLSSNENAHGELPVANMLETLICLFLAVIIFVFSSFLFWRKQGRERLNYCFRWLSGRTMTPAHQTHRCHSLPVSGKAKSMANHVTQSVSVMYESEQNPWEENGPGLNIWRKRFPSRNRFHLPQYFESKCIGYAKVWSWKKAIWEVLVRWLKKKKIWNPLISKQYKRCYKLEDFQYLYLSCTKWPNVVWPQAAECVCLVPRHHWAPPEIPSIPGLLPCKCNI